MYDYYEIKAILDSKKMEPDSTLFPLLILAFLCVLMAYFTN